MSIAAINTSVSLRSRLLRIHIDDRWTTSDFQQFFGAMGAIYHFFALSDAERSGFPTQETDLAATVQKLDLHFRSLIENSDRTIKDDALTPFAVLANAVRSDTKLRHFQFAERLEFFASYLRNLSLTDQRGALVDLDSAVYAARSRRFLEKIVLRPDHPPLSVRRCTYASPGITDLAGVAQTLGHVKDFVLQLITLRAATPERRIREELLAEDLRAARLRNVEQQIKLLKSVGYTDIQCRKILIELSESAVAIGALVERGQVKRVELVEKDDG